MAFPVGDLNQSQRLLVGLQELYDEQQLIDIILVVEGIRIPCHRAVLAASSRYFRAMFTNNVIENVQGEVELRDIEPNAVLAIVDYMYKGEICITNSNVQDVFMAASLLELLPLCDLCAAHMINELHVSNCIGIYQFGSFHHCTLLKNTGRKFIVDHLMEVINNEELLQLSVDDFAEIIADDNLNVAQEETVFEIMMKWITQDLDDRVQHLTKLFKLIRLPLISEEYIAEQIMTNDLITGNSYCKGLLSIARLYKTEKDTQDSDNDSVTLQQLDMNDKPRLGMFNTKMMVFLGGSQDKYNRALTCFDPKTKKKKVPTATLR